MGIDAKDIPHLALSAERGYGIIDLKKISVSPENWKDWVSAFDPPLKNLAINFSNVIIVDENSCSACQSTLLLLLKRNGEQLFIYFPKDTILAIAIGKGHRELPPNTLCIGNCTAQYRDKGIFVKGCPPVGSEILKTISGKSSEGSSDEVKSLGAIHLIYRITPSGRKFFSISHRNIFGIGQHV